MKTTLEIISTAMHLDRPTLDGFDPGDLPDAAKYRLSLLARRGTFDCKLDWESEIPALIALRVEPVEIYTEKPAAQDPWSYLVFADGSLYYSNNAEGEVWGDARDYIIERLINGPGRDAEEYDADSAEGRLIRAHARNLLPEL
jgi:hypothetical protein